MIKSISPLFISKPLFTCAVKVLLFIVCTLFLLPITGTSADNKQAFHLNPEFERGYSYSIAVKAGDFLYIGGVTAVDDAGNEIHAGDARKQMRVIYDRIKKILTAHGATFNNMISETIYYRTDTDTYLNTLDIRANHYKDIEGPTASGVKVAGFTSNNILIEVKAVAYLGK